MPKKGKGTRYLDHEIRSALQTDRLIDLTTIGRKSGKAARIETVFHYIEGRIYLTGRPGKRDWYANLLANPNLIFRLKESLQRELPARATPITAADERRAVLVKVLARNGKSAEIDEWVARSPLVTVELNPNHDS